MKIPPEIKLISVFALLGAFVVVGLLAFSYPEGRQLSEICGGPFDLESRGFLSNMYDLYCLHNGTAVKKGVVIIKDWKVYLINESCARKQD